MIGHQYIAKEQKTEPPPLAADSLGNDLVFLLVKRPITYVQIGCNEENLIRGLGPVNIGHGIIP